MDEYPIDLDGCRRRQTRLVAHMQANHIHLVLATQMENVQWLTGARFGPLFRPLAAVRADGHVTLVAPARKGRPLPEGFAVDALVPYESKTHSTLRNDQGELSAQALLDALGPVSGKVGCEGSTLPGHCQATCSVEWIDLEADFYRLRRKKEPDELRLMRKAIAATEAMYAHARQTIRPGLSELDLYSQLYAVTVAEFGEPPTYFGQDFQCNARGGPPRDRTAQAGELYILDLGTGFRGYFSDNARTLAVDGQPTDEQQQAWQAVAQVFSMVERQVKPGTSARRLFEEAQAMLDAHKPWVFNHHLGHGIGLYPHEAPHLNPHWDDVFEPGDVFAVEPGLYHESLRHGIRLEQNYLVTDHGVERLTNFSLEL